MQADTNTSPQSSPNGGANPAIIAATQQVDDLSRDAAWYDRWKDRADIFSVLLALIVFAAAFWGNRLGAKLARANKEVAAAKERLNNLQIAAVEAKAQTEAKRVESEGQERVASVEAEAKEKIAGLTAQAEQARAQIETAKKDAAQANEGAEQAAAEVARLQIVVANAETRRLVAERALLELQERLKDRHLTAEQRARLLELLKANPKGAINVSCIGGSSAEPCNFANELVSVLKAAGWEVGVVGWGFMSLGGTPVGLRIEVRDLKKAPIRAVILQNGLGDIGFPVPARAASAMDEQAVNLVVGIKPQRN